MQGWGKGEGWKEGDPALCWLKDHQGSVSGRAGTAVGRMVPVWDQAASGRDVRALGVRLSCGVCVQGRERVVGAAWHRAVAASKTPACCGQ